MVRSASFTLGWISGASIASSSADFAEACARRYTYALGAATQRFYDEPHLQRQFGKFWAAVAARLRPLPNVVGLELVNEPWYIDGVEPPRRASRAGRRS